MSLEKYIASRQSTELREVSFGYCTLTLLEAPELKEAQRGYRYDNLGRNLTGTEPGDWHPDWFVIAEEDYLGDPVFTNIAEHGFPIYTAMHVGEWVAERIADSFSGFVAALQSVALVSDGRESPNALEKNPLTADEQTRLFGAIQSRNPTSDLTFWQEWVLLPEE